VVLLQRRTLCLLFFPKLFVKKMPFALGQQMLDERPGIFRADCYETASAGIVHWLR
jgi:hypothetical protein